MILKLLALLIVCIVSQDLWCVVKTFDVRYPVDAKSRFEVKKYPYIVDYGKVKIASISFENNEEDGFEIVMSSKNGGYLRLLDSSDVVAGIPYTVELVPIQRILDDNMYENLSPVMDVPGYPIKLFSFLGQPQESSFGQYAIVLDIGKGFYQGLDIAGDYADTLEVVYRDI